MPYWSSHLDTASSELIVPTGHGAMNNPLAIAEIQRILRLNAGAARRNLASSDRSKLSEGQAVRLEGPPKISLREAELEEPVETGGDLSD